MLKRRFLSFIWVEAVSTINVYWALLVTFKAMTCSMVMKYEISDEKILIYIDQLKKSDT